MFDIDTLKSLREIILSAQEPHFRVDQKIFKTLNCGDLNYYRSRTDGNIYSPKFTSSIDAALALVERMLPGWIYTVGSPLNDNRFMCALSQQASTRDVRTGYAATAPLAILAALLSALIAQKEVA